MYNPSDSTVIINDKTVNILVIKIDNNTLQIKAVGLGNAWITFTSGALTTKKAY